MATHNTVNHLVEAFSKPHKRRLGTLANTLQAKQSRGRSLVMLGPLHWRLEYLHGFVNENGRWQHKYG